MKDPFEFRTIVSSDHDWMEKFIPSSLETAQVVVHEEIFLPADLPGFCCLEAEQPSGLITYCIKDSQCEIVSLNSLRKNAGAGTRLIELVVNEARKQCCSKVWLTTTNDNLRAPGFYQKRGFHLTTVFPGAVDRARKLKPSIPLIAGNGIPSKDEILPTLEL